MSKAETTLLKSAYDNYLKTKSLICTFPFKNADYKVIYPQVAEDLQEEGYIKNCVENFINLQFELTKMGLEYAIKNFENPPAEQ